MGKAPSTIGGRKVLVVAVVNGDVRATGYTIHRNSSGVIGPASALAICAAPEHGGVLLYYCDPTWTDLTDTWHLSVSEAKEQAELEYTGVSRKWSDAV